jgi:DNA-binding MarR family transcriptional regulator
VSLQGITGAPSAPRVNTRNAIVGNLIVCNPIVQMKSNSGPMSSLRSPQRSARPAARRERVAPAVLDEPMLALDAQLCFALYSTSLAVTKRYRELLRALGLTYPQYLVMLALWEQDGLSVSELGERLFLDSGTLTPLLKRLEAAQLIERHRAAVDERRVLVMLTATGRQLRRRAVSIPAALAGATGCALDELATLTTTLQRLRDSLGLVEDAAA